MSKKLKVRETLQPFSSISFEGKDFNIYGDFQNPLFLAKDVATWINHTDMSRMMNLVDKEEKLKRRIYVSGQNREMWFLTEQGMYEVLMQSRKPIAKEVKKSIKGHLKRLRTEGMTMQQTLSSQQQAEILINKLDEIYLKQEEELSVLEAEIKLLEEQVSILQLECDQADNEIEQAKPLADKYNEFLNSDGLMTIDDFSRITFSKYQIGRNNMYRYMRKQRFLHSGKKKNTPTKKLMQKNIFKLVDNQVFITAKGFDYFCNKLDERFNLNQ